MVFSSALPADVAHPTGFLQTLLTMSLTAVAVVQPLYAEDGETVRDFTWVYLNPAGQQLLGQPECPTASLLTLFPTAKQDGTFDVCCQAFATAELKRNQTNYQANGLDGYLLLVAQRYEYLLIINFTATHDRPPSPVEEAPPQSQAQIVATQPAAEAERQRLYEVLMQLPAQIATYQGPNHVFTFVNARFSTYVPATELLGRPVREVAQGTASQQVLDLLDRVYTTGQSVQGHELALTLPAVGNAPPRQLFLNTLYHPLRDAHGQIDGVLDFSYDVTEQVLDRQRVQVLNEELAAINKELRASNEEYLSTNIVLTHTQEELRHLNLELEARVAARTQEAEAARAEAERQRGELQRVFEQAPVAIFVLHGPDYVLTLVNAAMQEMLGPPLDELLGKPYFEAMPELADQGYADFLTQAWRTGQPYVAQEQPATLQRHGLGETGYFTFVYHPLQDVQGRVTDIMCVAVDVTAQVRARQRVQDLNEELMATNEELHESNTQLTRTNTDLDTFVYAASHDLKAPIANIEGLLDALRDFLPTEAQEPMVPRLVGMMEGAISRFQQTVGHLTDVSRLQATPAQGAEVLELARVLDDVRLDLLPLLESTRAQFLVDVAAYPHVVLSAKNLRSILYNLVSNAVKYRAPDRAPLVQVRARPAVAGGVVLEVQDNGLGLSEAQQGKLFTMFKRLHSHVEGSGVGLYMIKRLAENAGGTITVQSQPGVGSTFTVTLPRA